MRMSIYLMRMKVGAAYQLAVLDGNPNPYAEELRATLCSQVISVYCIFKECIASNV